MCCRWFRPVHAVLAREEPPLANELVFYEMTNLD